MEEYTTKAGLAITQRDSSRVAVEINTMWIKTAFSLFPKTCCFCACVCVFNLILLPLLKVCKTRIWNLRFAWTNNCFLIASRSKNVTTSTFPSLWGYLHSTLSTSPPLTLTVLTLLTAHVDCLIAVEPNAEIISPQFWTLQGLFVKFRF